MLMDHDNITDITTYFRADAGDLGERILTMFPPLQTTTDERLASPVDSIDSADPLAPEPWPRLPDHSGFFPGFSGDVRFNFSNSTPK